MGSVNKVILVGNLGQDPEMRYLPNGDGVCNFTIATSESWKGQDGSQQERTEWHRIVAFRKLAEICGEYLKKGKQVYIEGKIKTRSWEDKEGNKRYTTEVVADQMTMLGRRDDTPDNSYSAPPASAASAPVPAPQKNKMDDEDDLPF